MNVFQKYTLASLRKNRSRTLVTLIGIVLYLGLNTVLKMPFSKEFLNSGTAASHAVRVARYAFILFVEVALYPACFKFFKKKS